MVSGRYPVLLAGLLGAAASAMASEAGHVELRALRPPAPGEALQLQVTPGALPRDAVVEVLTQEGKALGTVAPYIAPVGTVETLPVPPDALSGGELRLRLKVIEPGSPPRPPRPGEVKRVELVLVPGGR